MITTSQIRSTTSNKEDTKKSVPMLELGVGIGGGVAALFLVVLVAFCVRRGCKSHSSELEDDNNPVYGVYGEVYEESEIYDTNAYYGVGEVEETGSTMVRDNNSQYE